jgi:hypothetical protein
MCLKVSPSALRRNIRGKVALEVACLNSHIAFRLQKLFIKFLQGRGKPIKDEKEVFNEHPNKAIPALVVLWIMDS